MKSQFAACARKTAYGNRSDAEAAAGSKFGVYLCPICSRYHLTSAKPGSTKRPPKEEPKPSFETSLLGRAKLKRPRAESDQRIEAAICLGKARPDGRVRLEIGGKELLSNPIQPASLRGVMKQGLKVRVKVGPDSCEVLGL